MLVKCIFNKIDDLGLANDARRRMEASYRLPDHILHLTIGDIYVVYALVIRNMSVSFFVADDDFAALGYPVPYESSCFRVVDDQLSRHWRFRCDSDSDLDTGLVFMSFSGWVDEEAFYEKLVDGENWAVEAFRQHKSLMDMEFPNPLVTAKALSVEGDWVMCPKCSEAWESTSRDGMLRCPRCFDLLLNPRDV